MSISNNRARISGRKLFSGGSSGNFDLHALVGSTFLWSWVGALYMSAFFVPFGRQGTMAEVATWLTSLMGVPICLVFLRRPVYVRKIIAKRKTLLASGLLGAVGSLLLIVAAQTGDFVVLAAGSFLGAIYLAVAIVAWGAPYCAGGVQTIALYVVGGYVCTLLPNVLFMLLMPPFSAYAFASLPLLSMALLCRVDGGLRGYYGDNAALRKPVVSRGVAVAIRRAFGVGAPTICGLVLIMLGIGYMEHRVSFSPSFSVPLVGDGAIVQLVHGVAAAILFAVMYFFPGCVQVAFRVGLGVIVAGFSFMPFLYGSDSFWLCGAIIISGYVVFDVLIWIIVAQSARNGSDAFASVCVTRLAVNGAFSSLGGILGSAVSRTGGFSAFACADAVLVGYLMTVAVMLVLGDHGVWGMFETVDDGQTAGANISISQRMQDLIDEWGFTAREAEVFELLAMGRTQPWIADHLGISENTVSSHVRRIYSKSGVNSRQELLDLVFSAQSRESREEVC